MKKTPKARLHSLDGLRGVAIIMVFLAHAPLRHHFVPFLPYELNLIINQTIHSSGFIGVSILFILSGFLMAYLYPDPSSKIQFIQKRYTRIFPLFLTMCIVTIYLRAMSHLAWYVQLSIIVLFAICTNLIWVKIIKRSQWGALPKVLFMTFILLQIVVGLASFSLYYVYDTKSFLSMPYIFHFISTTLVHGTLTFPLGGLVPLVSVSYGTLSLEVLFYVLYALLFVPIINARILRNNIVKVLLVIILLPFSYYLYHVLSPIQRIGFLQPHLIYHCIVGVVLGYLYRHYPNAFKKLGAYFSRKLYWLPILLLLGVILTYHFLIYQFNSNYVWIAITIAIPLAFIMAISLDTETSIAKIFSSKILVFIGTISYSIYLCHLVIISLLQSVVVLENQDRFIRAASDISVSAIAFIVTIIVSYILYQLLEKPYFAPNATTIIKK